VKGKGIVENEFKCTDIGNAERFQDYYDSQVRYITERKQFFQFDENGGWKEADRYILAKDVVRDIHREAAECDDDRRRVEIGQWANSSESAAHQRNFLEIAASYMRLSVKDFDANPYVINCKNGIVNLKTREFYHHSPEHLHLNCTATEYHSNAQCPRWKSFLEEIYDGDEELIKWIQVACGYAILGLTKEHCFFLCHGVGRNGKGTFLETIQYVLGDYGHKTNFETFLQKDKSSNVRAMEAQGDLRGKRFVIASETNDGTKFDAARIKELTGGDTLVGASLYSSKFQFKPTHTLWFACNHLPQIRDDTIAMWERVKTIPFNRMFLDDQQQKDLPEKLRNEAEGILKWLVDGAYEYCTNGLPATPTACRNATQEYREINDKLLIFIRQYLIKERGSSVDAQTVYQEYENWSNTKEVQGLNLNFINKRNFAIEIAKRGIAKKKTNKGMVFPGYRLRKPEERSDDGDAGK
jgi:putative DNA primase/helicase